MTRPETPRFASNKMPRRINANLVLSTLRKRQPISRVNLARASGLQPSTVTLIVDDLLAGGWLLEGEAVKGAMGRRPRLLTLTTERRVLAVDIHPRQTTLAQVSLSGEITWRRELALPRDPARATQRLLAALKEVIKLHAPGTFVGVGVCLPGRTDPTASHLIFAPNLLRPIVSLKAKLERATGLRVVMDNVANACALLEAWQMDEEQTHDLVVVEVSEGIGTGLFANGNIVRGKGGMAGEFGHIPMVANGSACNCGGHGCWETLASNRASVRYFRERSGITRRLSFSKVLALAKDGDADACGALTQTATHLGRGLQMIAASLAPSEIIVVGELTAAWGLIEDAVLAELRKHPLAQTVNLRPTYDGGSARLRSAVALVLGGGLVRD